MFRPVERKYFGRYKEIFTKSQFDTVFSYAFENQLGNLEVDDLEKPEYAKFLFANIMYFAGRANEYKAKEILATFPSLVAFIIEDRGWYELVEEFFSNKQGILFGTYKRTKFSNESLSLNHLRPLKAPLSEEFEVRRADKSVIGNIPLALKQHISLFFESDEEFLERGIGFCVLDGDRPVSLASSYVPYQNNKLEVEIETVDDQKYTRKGLATAACTALLEYCLENSISPTWDAQNEASAGLARKLEYTEKEKWNMYYYIERKWTFTSEGWIGKETEYQSTGASQGNPEGASTCIIDSLSCFKEYRYIYSIISK
jgi:RimJ/RimL family protein N-acetyltransferase